MTNRCCSPPRFRTAPTLSGAFAIGWLMLATPAVPAQAHDPSQPADVTRRLLDDARDGDLDDFDLPTAALVAGGVEDECELAGWLGDYYDKRAAALRQALATSSGHPLTALHRAMHERLLTGRYRSTASDLRLLLSRGDYNCLSAAVVFADLCREAGIELEFWLQPGHIYLCLRDGQRIDPASRRWQASRADMGVLKAGPSLDELDARARRLSPTELVAKFYYNRGLVRLAEHDYPAGLALLQISQALDPADRDARQNLVAGLNNWAALCCRQRQYEEAARLIEQGLRVEPRYEPLRMNRRLIEQLLAERVHAE